MQITEATRRDIIELFTIEKAHWVGRLEDIEFLSRLFDLKTLPSNDDRFSNAQEDIRQHRVNNYDWPDDWIFNDERFNLLQCDDEMFLGFLCETLHPIVRSDTEEVRHLQQAFNQLLHDTGFEIVPKTRLPGRAIYVARRIQLSIESNISALKQKFQGTDTNYILDQITRMETAIDDDPDLAIGTAKELIETICKTILSERVQPLDSNLTFPQLVKQTLKELKLIPDDIANEANAANNIKQISNNLASITNNITELRNSYGTGHGKDSKAKSLGSRHAKLVAGAATILAVFFVETHHEHST